MFTLWSINTQEILYRDHGTTFILRTVRRNYFQSMNRETSIANPIYFNRRFFILQENVHTIAGNYKLANYPVTLVNQERGKGKGK